MEQYKETSENWSGEQDITLLYYVTNSMCAGISLATTFKQIGGILNKKSKECKQRYQSIVTDKVTTEAYETFMDEYYKVQEQLAY